MGYQYDPAFQANDELARELLSLTGEDLLATDAPPVDVRERERLPLPLSQADAIVSHIEVNQKQGVGVLLERLFGRSTNILSIRSEDHFGGRQDFGDFDACITHTDLDRTAVTATVREVLGENTVGRIVCVPYYPNDVRNALALADITKAPMATYLMDDQNICADGIPDELMRELLDRSALRLAISSELAACYEVKYGHKQWLMPPVAPSSLLLDRTLPPDETLAAPRTGAILGNIWGQRWLDLLRETVRGTGVTLRWYSTNHLRYLEGSPEELAADGIEIPAGPPLGDRQLIEVMRRTAFVVIPSGTLGDADDRRYIAQLSLPSRIPFLLATAQTPFLVLGSERTGAARFVRDLGIGTVCDYDPDAFGAAVELLTKPPANQTLRRRMLALASRFSDAGAAEWIWQSLEKGEAFDLRYEDLMRRPRPDIEALVRVRGQSE